MTNNTTTNKSYLSAELLAQVKKAQIKLRKNLDTDFAGQFRSAFPGTGLIFQDLKEYEPGDEIKHIHWRASARSGKTYVKKYQEDRNINIMLIVDLSPSVFFGKDKSKIEKIREFSALIAHLAKTNGDSVGLCSFGDKVYKYLPSRSHHHQLQLVLTELFFTPTATTLSNLSAAISEVNKKLTKKSLVFILTDFFAENYENELKILGFKHDVICVLVDNQLDYQLPKAGLIELEDSETSSRYLFDSNNDMVTKKLIEFGKLRSETINKKVKDLGASFFILKDNPVVSLQSFMKTRIKRK